MPRVPQIPPLNPRMLAAGAMENRFRTAGDALGDYIANGAPQARGVYNPTLALGGVGAEDIFELRDRRQDGLTIEDFVDAEAYRLAVNEELRRSGHTDHQFARGELPAIGRVAHVEAWANGRGIGNPSKVRVAGRVVEPRFCVNPSARAPREGEVAVVGRFEERPDPPSRGGTLKP